MRTRLFGVFLAPLICILLALGGAYAWSAGRTIQQEFATQQLGDLSYFATEARQALRAENPTAIEGELARYSSLFGAQAVVVDRAGAPWASGAEQAPVIDDAGGEQLALALSGRRSERPPAVWPWSPAVAPMAEPIFDDGVVIGAVLISASTDAARTQTLTQWVLLLSASIIIILLLGVVVSRLANWVLRPMLRVDHAMAAIEQGDMEARIDDDTGPPEMQRMIRVFNQMADEIERVVSRQQEFVMNASHELRNPLGALTLRVESLATGLDASWADEIEETREEGRRMSRLLDTLLFMAKAMQKDSPFAPVDLGGLARDRADAWRAVAERKGVGIGVSGDAGVWSVTDRTAVESALDAVLDNAVKFAPAGTAIEVDVRQHGASAGGDGGGEYGTGCAISVRDHGPGLDPDEIERAAGRFWRSPRDQNVPGSGLGLAIATDLLASLGGHVRVAAADGGGLEVELRLPGGGL